MRAVRESDVMSDSPPPSDRLVARPELLRRLKQDRTIRLALIVAPAGYGKTTLLDQWLQAEGSDISYLRQTLSEADNDPAHFLVRLSTALQRLLPDATPLPAVAETESSLSYSLTLLLRRAAEVAHSDWRLVLDDYQFITNPAIHQALDALLNLPTWPVRLIIASRSLPPLTAIARLRVEGRLIELDETHLRFTSSETKRLLEACGFCLDEKQIEWVTARAEGWPVALRLIAQATGREVNAGLAPGADLLALLEHIGQTSQLFDYLVGQVLSQQPIEVRHFLCHTALLSCLEVDLCNALLGITTASAILDTLERNHLFVTRLTEGPGRRYRYHALFQEFLCRWLEQAEGAQAVRDWQRRAAHCFLDRQAIAMTDLRVDDSIAAIHHLLAGQDWIAAADVIEASVERLDWGQVTLMETWFSRLPTEIVNTRPRLLLALGLLRERQCRWNEALVALSQADRALASSEARLKGRALYRQARVYLRQGRHVQAIDLCQQALIYLSPAGAANDQAEIFRFLGACYYRDGDFDSSEKYLRQALKIFQASGDRSGEGQTAGRLAEVYWGQGRFADCIEVEQLCLRIHEELGSYQVCNSLIGLSDTYRLRGDYETARALVERALPLAVNHQDPLLRGYALFVLGHVHLEQGQFQAAHACYAEARLLGEELREPGLLCEPQRGLALLALAEGDHREAVRYAQAVWQHMQAVGHRLFEGQARTTLGLILSRTNESDRAKDHLDGALRLFEKMGAHFDQAVVHLYLADLYRRQGQDEESLIHLDHCLALSQRYGYDFLCVIRERECAIPLLVNALAQTSKVSGESWDHATSEVMRLLSLMGQEAVAPLLSLLESVPKEIKVQENVIRLLGEVGDERAGPALDRLRRSKVIGPTAHAALKRIADRPCPPLRVFALGGFRVFKGDLPLPVETWPRRKTRLLLLYLLTQRRRVPRDELIEALWPDLSPRSAGLALNTTFSELRKLLEPHLVKGMSSRYLLREDESYTFNFESNIWYDAQAFEQAVREGGQAALRAQELYRGEWLPEEPYVDWVLRERERLRGLYLNTLMMLLDNQVQQGAWHAGIDLARRILDQEPWLEEVWQALITCYSRLGRRSEALQAYLTCERNLRQELDAAPSPQLRALYERLKA